MEAMPFQFGLMITSWQLPFYMMGIDCLLNPYPLNPYSLNPYPLNPYPLPLPPSPHLLTFKPYPLTFKLNAMEAMPFQFGLMITSWQLPFYMMGAACFSTPIPLTPTPLTPTLLTLTPYPYLLALTS
jgi:hypothetical protein